MITMLLFVDKCNCVQYTCGEGYNNFDSGKYNHLNNTYNHDTYSLDQPIGKKCRNNPVILLVRKSKDFGGKGVYLFSFHSHNE